MRVVVCRVEEFPAGDRKIVKAGARSIGVFNVDGEYFAIRNRCPHQGGPLCLGRLSPWAVAAAPGQAAMEGPPRLIACPWHGWEYDLETGQSFMGPAEPHVKAYDVTVASGAALGENVGHAEEQPIPAGVRVGGRQPGPYVAETFRVYVEAEYVVVEV
jgi:nitrite reductase/ring-hydroxylating ferredoxin subunit